MKTQQIIQEIHNAFDAAEDVLYKEAVETTEVNKINSKDKDYVKKMAELGFVNAKGVQETSEKMRVATENAKLAKLVLHYKKTYPFLKFLTEEKLDEICEKYNLIHAPVKNYIGDVPEKNLREIANAQPLKDHDRRMDDSAMSRLAQMVREERTDRQKLFIAAPEKDFNLDGLTKKGKRGFFKTIITQRVDDPIVFRYCRGGIQILSKWGLEANDPELATPLDN